MRTVKQWLESIADEKVRRKAIGYTSRLSGDREKSSLYFSIVNAFFWDDTEEGHKYWQRIANDARSGTLKTIEP